MRKRLNDSKMMALLMVLLIFVTVQCSSFVKTTYSSLGTAGILYDTSMKTIAELYEDGRMSEEAKQEAVSIAQDYYAVYMSAVAALEVYQGMSAGDKEGQKMRVLELMEKLSEIGGHLAEIINKYK